MYNVWPAYQINIHIYIRRIQVRFHVKVTEHFGSTVFNINDRPLYKNKMYKINPNFEVISFDLCSPTIAIMVCRLCLVVSLVLGIVSCAKLPNNSNLNNGKYLIIVLLLLELNNYYILTFM